MSSQISSSLTRKFGDLKIRPKLMVLHNLFFLVLTCAAYVALIPFFEEQVAPTIGDYSATVTRARITLFVVLGIIYVLAVILLEAVIMPLYVYGPLRIMLMADLATQAGDRERELIPSPDIMDDEIGQIMRSRNDTIATLRRQEDELATALRRLEEQDRLVSLGLLSASVAHELNTPLAVLNGSLEKIIETTSDSATLDRLERMQRVTRRLRTISESLVDFARVRQQHMEPVAIRGAVDEAWGLVAIDEKAGGVQFTNLVGEEMVNGNVDKLVQVFVNLLRNAVFAFDAPGSKVNRIIS